MHFWSILYISTCKRSFLFLYEQIRAVQHPSFIAKGTFDSISQNTVAYKSTFQFHVLFLFHFQDMPKIIKEKSFPWEQSLGIRLRLDSSSPSLSTFRGFLVSLERTNAAVSNTNKWEYQLRLSWSCVHPIQC